MLPITIDHFLESLVVFLVEIRCLPLGGTEQGRLGGKRCVRGLELFVLFEVELVPIVPSVCLICL